MTLATQYNSMSKSTEAEVSGGYLDFQSIATQLGTPRRELLKTLLGLDISIVNTSKIREETSEVPDNSTLHHLERLEGWGLVEEHGREYHGTGGDNARTWELTDRGMAFCEEHLDASVSTTVATEDVAALTQRMDALENDVEEVQNLVIRIAVKTGIITEEQAAEMVDET